MPNLELAKRVLAQIEADPATWNQEHWAYKTECGTSYCFAGWALKLAYQEPQFLFWGYDDEATYVRLPKGETTISSAADAVLGISQAQGELLFWAENTLDDLRAYVQQLGETGELTPSARYIAWELEDDTAEDDDWDEDDPDGY